MTAYEWCKHLYSMMGNCKKEYNHYMDMAKYAPNMEIEEWCKLMARCRQRDYQSMMRVYEMYCMKCGKE